MFRKNKKSESTFTATASADPLSLNCSNLNEECNSLSNAYIKAVDNTLTTSVSWEHAALAYSAYPSTPSFAIPADFEHMLHEIYEKVCKQLTPLESVLALVSALEDMRCPVDSCKNCKYHTPGGVDACDTNRHIAEYLVESGIVKVFERKS